MHASTEADLATQPASPNVAAEQHPSSWLAKNYKTSEDDTKRAFPKLFQDPSPIRQLESSLRSVMRDQKPLQQAYSVAPITKQALFNSSSF